MRDIFCGELTELYSNKGIRSAISQHATDLETRHFVQRTLGPIQSACKLWTKMSLEVSAIHVELKKVK
jgi:hypothetical protein